MTKKILEIALAVISAGMLFIAVTGKYFGYEILPGERVMAGMVVFFFLAFFALGNVGLTKRET